MCVCVHYMAFLTITLLKQISQTILLPMLRYYCLLLYCIKML